MSIYFLQPTEGGAVKIGCSVDVERRHQQLENRYGKPLTLLKVLPGGRGEERAIHERFAGHRIGRTEQFRPAHDLMAFLGVPILVSVNPDAVEALQGKTVQARIDKELFRKLRVLASLQGTETTAILDDLIRDKIEEEYYQLIPSERPSAPEGSK